MATIKYKDPATGEIRKIPFVVGNSTPESFYGVLPLEKGGTGSYTASGARTNLMVAQKPKLLWWGVFSNGSITVDGLSDYTHFLIQMNGTLLLGTISSGIISLGTFQCDSSAAGRAALMTANVAVNGDTLTMNHTFYVAVNNTNWYQSAADAHVQINGIWGLYKAEDMQEETT